MRQSTTWGGSFCAGNVWRDKRTGTILAPGALQNWPTPREEQQMNAERGALDRHNHALILEEQKREEQKRAVAELMAKKK